MGRNVIGGFFGEKKLDSIDFYIAIKINPINLGLNLKGKKIKILNVTNFNKGYYYLTHPNQNWHYFLLTKLVMIY